MTTITAAALKYPFDRTGIASTNLIVNEARSVGREVYRAIAPYAGSFYTKSMVITDAATATPLVLNVDYKISYPNQEAELEVGKPICTVVMILNSSYTDVLLTYQAVGGPYTTSNNVIAQLITDSQQDNRAVTWDAILGKPVTFNPSAHLHAATDLYGLEYVVLALEELVQSVYTGDVSSHDVLYDYINRIKDAVDASIIDFNNQTTETRALLDALTLRVDALTATVTQLRADFNAHASNVSNPHAVTSAQVGLGLVQNYRIAIQTEAEAGTANNVYTTPLSVWQAITKYTALNITPVITTHVNNVSNPHGVTATQVGLGNVLNVPQVQRGGGAGMGTNSLYMGWDGSQVLLQVDNSSMGRVHTTQQPDPNIASHVNNRSNPHGVTIGQIGAADRNLQINGHSLTSSFNLGANEVGAYTSAQGDGRYAYKNSASIGQNGWSYNADTGLLTQWGYLPAAGAAGFSTVSYPRSFPNACLNVQVTAYNSGGKFADNYSTAGNVNANNFLCGRDSGGSFWMATGY